ncbi:hypothetical protein CASFOL_014661 [Castilleja foliolosa]|uniref:KIB1-4 beta-propeller domain-containing protein n=1 Tax=Castilleja foliolosa TaxID=1961234 RepID=A0ABD3DC26_9LAMI
MMMSTGVNSSPSSGVMSQWLLLPPVIEEGGDLVYKFYYLSEDKEETFPNSEVEMADAKFVGSSHGWLALFDQRNHNHIFLYNPITHRHIKLPPIKTLPDPRINLTPNGGLGSVYKLILSSSPDDDECIAMMIFGLERRLVSCHPCRSTEWTPIGVFYNHFTDEGTYPRSYLDIVYSSTQKLFFCQTNRLLECWDLSNSLSSRIHSSWDFCGVDFPDRSMERPQVRRRVNLVYAEEYNQLFLVMRYFMVRMSPDGSHVSPIYFGDYRGWDNSFPYRTIGFHAYKIDFGVEKPQYVEGCWMVLPWFIGINHSIAMSLTPQLKLSSNCIYYTDSMAATILAFLIIQIRQFLLAILFPWTSKA